jgi:8-oxo-dGTP pyrophosphatase MutT (NUDIX family)
MLGLGEGDSKAPPAPPRDAATVILLRPADTTPFEVLLLRRTGRAGFLANALVFPGGRVDPADAAHAEHLLEPDGGTADHIDRDVRTDRQKARDRKAKERALLLEFNALFALKS